jgi:superfamily II DNA or RNA helicase
MPKIYDNIKNQLVNGLDEIITDSTTTRVDFCVGYFNLRGWKQIASQIDNLIGANVTEIEDYEEVEKYRVCRLLVGMQNTPKDQLYGLFSPDGKIDNATALRIKKKLAQEFREQLTIGTPNQADENALRKLSEQLKNGKVVVKLFAKHQLHAKLYLTYSNNPRSLYYAFLGSSNLTFSGLKGQGELNTTVEDTTNGKELATWFDDRWNDQFCFDISEELIEIIDNSWAAENKYTPYDIYLKIAYHLSREARAGINEYTLPKEFRDMLFEYQAKAVQIAAYLLNKRGGVMIGDVVGLGKTITATALARIFQDDFYHQTLILCPANLMKMWENYRLDYNLNALIVSSTNLKDIRELIDLNRFFKTVIIDESHNLRSGEGSRYKAIKEYLTQFDTAKVILLSATPYNKTYNDLSNQLRLFLADDQNLGFSPENYIESVGGAIKFQMRHSDTHIQSIKAFEKSEFADDWRELMRHYMIRRTRSFIKKNYATFDEEKQRYYLTFADKTRSYFPDRIPRKVEYPFIKGDQYEKLYDESVVEIMNNLNLPRYGLGSYIIPKPKEKPTEAEQNIINNLGRAGARLKGFARTNLFKRLESSGYAFLLSLSRHLVRNYLFIYILENDLQIPIGDTLTSKLDEWLEDADSDQNPNDENILNPIVEEQVYQSMAKVIYDKLSSPSQKHKSDWVKAKFFDKSLLTNLKEDSKNLISILEPVKDWSASKDRKLIALYDFLTKTHPNEKVLIFSQYADTVDYLYTQLKQKGITEIARATGNSEDPTALARRFSPHSNKYKITNSHPELRVLIASDVLSEGQNLQDAHVIVNFDLPWAIIRLIQRAGRVDRIGQQADKIFCYSFLPEAGIERIIKLRKRLTDRIKENAEVVGSDEIFFDGDPINIQDIYSEKSGILDDMDKDEEVDLSSMAYQIWKDATERDPSLLKKIPNMPNVVYATKANPSAAEREGVIVYSRTPDDNDMLSWIDKQGKIITNSQLNILRALECDENAAAFPKLENHHELVAAAVEHINELDKNISGVLGRKNSVKYKIYTMMDAYIRANENTLFVNEPLKKALDDIYRFPLKEFAKDSLGRLLRIGATQEQFAELIVSLYDENKLSIISEDDTQPKLAQIICSMGLVNQ